MVRKRTRTSRKQYYDSDENDSDSDFALDDSPAEPAPKKYSLRQRKRPLFTEDFDYDDDGEEIVPPKVRSDDEDFEVEKELELEEASDMENVGKSAFKTECEADSKDLPEDANGLIDFEDMIRADIVVNKNRIDYDNIIQKTEIKMQAAVQAPPVKSKRGRKPKIRPVEAVISSILEPETEVLEEPGYDDKNDEDYNPNDDMEPIDCAKLMNTELTEESTSNSEILPNPAATTVVSTKEPEIQQEELKHPSNIPAESNVPQESVIKVNDNCSKNIQTNGKVSPDDLLKPEENLSDITKQENDDDDVVLVEDKNYEVIVLDD